VQQSLADAADKVKVHTQTSCFTVAYSVLDCGLLCDLLVL